MIIYEYGEYQLAFIWRREGSTLPKAALMTLPSVALALVLRWMVESGYETPFGPVRLYKPDSFVWGCILMVLSMLLGFRSSTAYNRFWEGCTLVQAMSAEWFEACSNLIAFSKLPLVYHPNDAKKRMAVRDFQTRLVRMMSLMHGVALRQIGGNCEEFDVLDVAALDDASMSYLKVHCAEWEINRVEVLLHWITVLITDSIANEVLIMPPPILTRSYQTLSRGMVNLHNVRKIADIPYPFPLSQMIIVLLLVQSIATPFIIAPLVESYTWASIATFMPLLGMWSVTFIAGELEQPFGQDPNDLPLAMQQFDFNNSLLMLVDDRAQNPPTLKEHASRDPHQLRTLWSDDQEESTSTTGIIFPANSEIAALQRRGEVMARRDRLKENWRRGSQFVRNSMGSECGSGAELGSGSVPVSLSRQSSSSSKMSGRREMLRGFSGDRATLSRQNSRLKEAALNKQGSRTMSDLAEAPSKDLKETIAHTGEPDAVGALKQLNLKGGDSSGTDATEEGQDYRPLISPTQPPRPGASSDATHEVAVSPPPPPDLIPGDLHTPLAAAQQLDSVVPPPYLEGNCVSQLHGGAHQQVFPQADLEECGESIAEAEAVTEAKPRMPCPQKVPKLLQPVGSTSIKPGDDFNNVGVNPGVPPRSLDFPFPPDLGSRDHSRFHDVAVAFMPPSPAFSPSHTPRMMELGGATLPNAPKALHSQSPGGQRGQRGRMPFQFLELNEPPRRLHQLEHKYTLQDQLPNPEGFRITETSPRVHWDTSHLTSARGEEPEEQGPMPIPSATGEITVLQPVFRSAVSREPREQPPEEPDGPMLV